MSKAFLFLLFVIASLIAACSDDNSTNVKPDKVNYELELMPLKNFELAKLPYNQKAMSFISLIKKEQEVSFSEVTKFFIDKQVQQFGPFLQKKSSYYTSDGVIQTVLADQHRQFLSSVVSSSILNPEFFQIKGQYEQELKNRLGKDLLISHDASSTPHIEKYGHIQTQSATHMHLLAARMSRSGLQYRKENYVVVFLNGAMKPGRFINIGGDWVLFAVDPLSSSDGVERIGLARDLEGCIRVVDADYYVLASALMDYIEPNTRDDLVSNIEDITAEKFGMDLDLQDFERCEKSVSFIFGPNVEPSQESAFMPKYFSIGYHSYKKDQIERKKLGMSAAEAHLFIQIENQQVREMNACLKNPRACVILPPIGNIQTQLYIRKSELEKLVIPYVFETTRDKRNLTAAKKAYALMVSPAFYDKMKNDLSLQCKVLEMARDLSRTGVRQTRYKTADYDFLDLHFEPSENDTSSGSFALSLNGMSFSSSITGLFSVSRIDLLTLDGMQKQRLNLFDQMQDVISSVRGVAPLIRLHEMNRIEQACIRHKFSIPGSYR